MITFVDESGKFVPNDGWSVVAALTLTHGFGSQARRKLISLTQNWVHVDGELKGRSLSDSQVNEMIDVLWRHQALLHVVAINVSLEDADRIRRHKLEQAQKMTQNLTEAHNPGVISEVRELRTSLEAMPDQLYIQTVVMTQLIWECAQNAAMYFSLRKPEELALFEWKIDAKSPKGETKQEQWWKTVLGPMVESNAHRHQFISLDDEKADYSFFERSYAFEKRVWRPSGDYELVSGFDVGKLIVKSTQFVDSRSDIFLQAADILANRIRRCFQEAIFSDGTAASLGRLQIRQSRHGARQLVKLITLTNNQQADFGVVSSRLKLMYDSARGMFPHAIA